MATLTPAARFAYDDVPYDSEATSEAHPSALATLARLAGLTAAAPARARVLEIGCGNGENLICAADYLPDASFVGFDLAADAVAAGAAAVKEASLGNVVLFAADLRAVRAERERTGANGSFDYVIAHGMYSWLPESARSELLALMREALAPEGIGFLSVNALPGWELRRAFRELARDRVSALETPAEKVNETLRLVAEIGSAGRTASGFFGALSSAAREYAEHVARATPPEAPFSRYVFHDLIADYNDPFSVAELGDRLGRSGLRIVCEAPLLRARVGALDRGDAFAGLSAEVARSGLPFLQVLVQRDDAVRPREPDPTAIAGLELWADLEPVSTGTYRTTTGAVVRPEPGDGLSRAAMHAPGFVAVRDLASVGAPLDALSRQLFAGFCEGVFTLVVERPPSVAAKAELPCVAEHVRARAGRAVDRESASAVLTSAIHRSFRVPWPELAVVRLLDGRRDVGALARDACAAAARVRPSLAGPLATGSAREVEAFVASVIRRFTRHLFLRSST
jgi:SAM-dependent methyltransferase